MWGLSESLWHRPLLEGWKVKVKVPQLYPTLCNPMDYTVHGVLQATILEWVAFPISRGSSQSRDLTQVSHIASGFFTNWAIRESFMDLLNWLKCGSMVKCLPAITGDTGAMGSVPGSGRPPWGRNGNPLQYSCLENPIHRRAWRATIHGVTKESDTTERLRTQISLTCQHRPLFPLLKTKMEKKYMFKDRKPDFWPEPSAGLALIYLLNKHFIEVLSINI